MISPLRVILLTELFRKGSRGTEREQESLVDA
jgi:hypothetical protein